MENALWNSVFAVPAGLVDEHLKLCSGPQLKVLLTVLRKNTTAPENIAGFLGLPVADVIDALNYWVRASVLTVSGEPSGSVPERSSPPKTVSEKPAHAQPPPLPVQKEAVPDSGGATQTPGSFRRKLTPRQINELSREDNNIAFLLQESQMILGKPLTPVATDTITALYSYYGMRPEVILMLLQYCVAQNKDNMRYVEKVAAGWIEAGIDTHEKAEREIVNADSRGKLENIIRRLFGIHDRTLITSEREYINSWKDQGLSVELIGIAYERTIEQKGKLSFAYINGILQNWKSKGIASAEQALEEIRRGKKAFSLESADAVGLDEMEQMFRDGDV